MKGEGIFIRIGHIPDEFGRHPSQNECLEFVFMFPIVRFRRVFLGKCRNQNLWDSRHRIILILDIMLELHNN